MLKGKRYYQIPGHLLMLKHDETISLNFSYFNLEEDEKGKISVAHVTSTYMLSASPIKKP